MDSLALLKLKRDTPEVGWHNPCVGMRWRALTNVACTRSGLWNVQSISLCG
jgi:hypothetical protein